MNPTSAPSAILPPAILGMLGGGQLGAMFVDAAHALGYRVHVFSPMDGEPACLNADFKTIAPYSDLAAVGQFAQSVAAVSYEFENVPEAAAAACAAHAPVRPGRRVLQVAQHRVLEKTFFSEHGLACAPWARIAAAADAGKALAACGLPAVLKTAHGGYDGKGQIVIQDGGVAAIEAAWLRLGGVECVLEAFVDFTQEVSVVAARGVSGKTVCYGPILNHHRHHILDESVYPAPSVTPAMQEEALAMASRVMAALQAEGVLCLELFQTRGGGFLCNEMAPRPHNSGHLTMDGFGVSQFRQQVLTLCGRDPQDPDFRSPVAMRNLLGDLWFAGGSLREPNWQAARAMPGVTVHLYGKTQARHGRKMGHLNAVAETAKQAAELAGHAYRALRA